MKYVSSEVRELATGSLSWCSAFPRHGVRRLWLRSINGLRLQILLWCSGLTVRSVYNVHADSINIRRCVRFPDGANVI
jgi:hypothetical protein